MEHHSDNNSVGVLYLVITWAFTLLTKIQQSDITFVLSCGVSFMAMRHYYLQNRKSKKDETGKR